MSLSKNLQHIVPFRQSAPVPSRRGKKTVVVAVAVGMAVALSGCNGGTGKSKSKDKDSGTAVSKPKSPSGKSASKRRAGNKPIAAGWQTQTAQKHHFRYDVPAKARKWKVLGPDMAASYTDGGGKPIVVMTGAAHYREGGCASSPSPEAVGQAGQGQLATVGTTGGGKDGSLQENARNWAGNWGFAAYGGPDHKPKITVSGAKPWKQGGINGYTATAKVKVTHRPSRCVPATAVVHSIAQKLPDGTMHGWVLYADQGVPKALTGGEIKKVMKTVRSTDS